MITLNPRTLGDLVEGLTGGLSLADLASWPPDVFAVTGALLSASGAFALVVSPPVDQQWPPDDLTAAAWDEKTRDIAASWSSTASPEGDGSAPPDVEEWISRLDAAAKLPLQKPDSSGECLRDHWDVVCALVAVHVCADEALAGLGGGGGVAANPAVFRARLRLSEHGTVSTLPPDRIRVLPKLRTPTGGITVRSLSRHMAVVSPDVKATWVAVPRRQAASKVGSRFNLLVVPWPEEIVPKDFKVYDGQNLLNLDQRRYGFFTYSPDREIDPKKVVDLVLAASARTGATVDAVVFPEAALTRTEVDAVQAALREGEGNLGEKPKDYKSPAFLFAGIREEAVPGTGEGDVGKFGKNCVLLAIPGVDGDSDEMDDWETVIQHKHHRWCIDAPQIQQYHLGAALHPARQWWEAIALPARERVFVEINDWLTLCPVICEDLARLDPATDSVHAVGPTLVVSLLLDGPQLDSRWSARYATVLADDPGSSVLSVTSLGMALRSRPAEVDGQSRTIALWKDRQRGVRQISLDEDSDAVLLTLCVEERASVTADGRSHDTKTHELVLAGIEQLSCGGLTDVALPGGPDESEPPDLEKALHPQGSRGGGTNE